MTKNAANAVAAVCWHWLKIMAATVDTTHLPLLATVCLSFSSCSALAVVYQHCKALAKTNVATAHKHLLRIMATAAEEHHPPVLLAAALCLSVCLSYHFPRKKQLRMMATTVDTTLLVVASGGSSVMATVEGHHPPAVSSCPLFVCLSIAVVY